MAKRRLLPVAGLFVVGVLLVLLAQTLGTNVVYFQTPSEALAIEAPSSTRLRLAGAVVPDSVIRVDGGVAFQLTDGLAVVNVRHQGEPPELFADGAPVVCEGSWSGRQFQSDRLMIKHGSEYRPPDVLETQAATPNARAMT